MDWQRTLMDARAAATSLGVAPGTLAKWRVTGDGPPFVKLGARVRYDRDDLDRWLDANRHRTTGDRLPGPGAPPVSS